MQKPASVTTFGILNIVFAALGIITVLGSLAYFKISDSTMNPVMKIMHTNPAYMTWMKISIPLGLISSIALLIAGIGLLNLKEWARKVSIGYAVYAIVLCIFSLVFNFLYLFLPLLTEASQKQGPEAIGAIAGALGGSIGSFFGFIYPILLLIFTTRPKFAAAFRPAGKPPVLPAS